MVESIYQELLKHIADVKAEFPLGKLHPLGAGGVADYYTVARDAVELAAAVKAAIDAHLPYLVIGQAEGVLFSDGGFPGLVIHNQANHFVIANDRSQMVVDSGMSLQHFITKAAGQGFGGLIHLYGIGGSIGGAVYRNSTVAGRSILSSVRYVTLIMPPTKMKVEPTIVRYQANWLERNEEMTKLQWLRQQHPEAAQPVILNVQFQLTSVRSDELLRRIHQEAVVAERQQPRGAVWGPVFAAVPGVEVEELLQGVQVGKLRVNNVQVHRRFPNYFTVRGRNPARSGEIRELIELIQNRVQSHYSVTLEPSSEFVGAW